MSGCMGAKQKNENKNEGKNESSQRASKKKKKGKKERQGKMPFFQEGYGTQTTQHSSYRKKSMLAKQDKTQNIHLEEEA